MDLTVAEVRGFVSAGMVKTGNPDFRWLIWPELRDSPFLASSEITAPAEELLAPAISFAAASIESSMSSVVLIWTSSHLML
jgi:hypothetical protein